MNREGIQRLTKEKISRRIREGVKGRCLRRFIWGRGPKEDWAFKRYTDMAPLWVTEEKPTKIAT